MPMEHCIVWGSRVRLLHSVRQPYGVIRAKLYRRILVCFSDGWLVSRTIPC